MHEDYQSQIDRAKEIYQDLIKSCNQDLTYKKISPRTRELTQEILTKIRHLLDQVMHAFFRKHYQYTLPEEKAKKARVYFPIRDDLEKFKFCLEQAMMLDLESKHPDFFEFLEAMQPYKNQDNLFLKDFRNFSNEKHIHLTPQVMEETEKVRVSNSADEYVEWEKNSIKLGPGHRMWVISPSNKEAKVESIKWVAFNFQGTKINVLSFCRRIIEEGEKIVLGVSRYL